MQDWELISGSQTDTHTILKFKRPLYTCDRDWDNDIAVGGVITHFYPGEIFRGHSVFLLWVLWISLPEF